MPRYIAATGRHADTGDQRRSAVHCIGFTDQAGVDSVACRISDARTAAVEGQGDTTSAGEARYDHGVGSAVDLGHAGQATCRSPAIADGEVAGVHAAHIFAKGNGVVDRAAIGGRGIGAYDAGHAGYHGIYQHACTADSAQRQGQVITRRVLDAAAVEIDAAGQCDAVGIVVTGLHGVLEHQRAIARTRYIAGITGDTAHGQRQARRAARSIDHNTFTGIDGEAQDVTHLVAAVLRQAHAVDHRHYSVHLHATGVADVVQYQGGVVADRIAQGAAVQLNGVAQGDAVAIDLAGDHAQAEYQRSAAGTGHVRCVGDFTIIECDLDTRRTSAGIDQGRFAQVDGEVQVLPGHITAVGRHADAGNRR